LPRLDLDREATQDRDVGPGRVAEVDVLELEVALARPRLLAVRTVGVDLGLAATKLEHTVDASEAAHL
jgi:hypothetical protein